MDSIEMDSIYNNEIPVGQHKSNKAYDMLKITSIVILGGIVAFVFIYFLCMNMVNLKPNQTEFSRVYSRPERSE